MKLTVYSKNRIVRSAERWRVEREYFEPLYNYLVYGWEPGSFWRAVLENDWFGAIVRSHPGNNVEALKNASKWITAAWPREIYGNQDNVQEWCRLNEYQRRLFLESVKLIYTEREEVELSLRGESTHELEIY